MSDCCNNCGCGSKGDEDKAPRRSVLNPEVKTSAETTLKVAGMDCPDEVEMIERVLKPLPGVRGIEANLLGAKVTVLHDGRITLETLIKAIRRTGLTAHAAGEGAAEHAPALAQRSRLIAVGLSGVLALAGLVVHWLRPGPEWPHIALFVAAIVSGGWFILPKAITAARRFAPDMNLLMSVAVIGAAGIGQWSEAAAVTFLFGLSELLEAFSVNRARRAIQSLLGLSPQTALLQRGDRFDEVPVGEVKTGDTISVKSGGRIPLDGTVTRGRSAVNQAPITGESMPVGKKPGDEVFAGTINGDGSLEVEVTKTAGHTMLARIIHLVEEAQAQKAPAQRFVDAFAKYYTPSVMVLAALVFFVPPLVSGGAWGVWFYRALVLLVIACPCALVISTPVSVVSGLTAMARRGVLIKGGTFLESIGKLHALAVDKTGTITEGCPRVMRVIRLNNTPEDEIVRIAAAIDDHSDHPLAQAVTDYATEKGVRFPRGENYQARTGRGAEAEIAGHHYFVGNHRFTHELAVCSEEIERKLAEIESDAQSIVVVGHKPHADCKGEVLGILAVGDPIRADALQAIRSLHAAGLRKVVMLSGDNQRTVDAIARQVGIDEAEGDLLPDDKIERVRTAVQLHKTAPAFSLPRLSSSDSVQHGLSDFPFRLRVRIHQ